MKPRHPASLSAKAKSTRSRECRAIFAALSEFVDGTLPERNCRKLREHLSGCRPCIEYLESLKRTIDLCRAYKSPAAPPLSPAVRQAFAQALSSGLARRRR